jgi:LuxR family transcriptional regulator, maltose regulon positive regulatory protein
VIPHPPSPLVLRPRLFRLLNEGTQGPLTLVSAPAGSGKTSLLSSWLSVEPQPVAWLTTRPQLSEATFWSEFLSALQRVVPARSSLARISAPKSGSPPGFLVELLNGFAELEEPVTVVVDDFQNVRSAAVAATFDQLLRAAPTTLRLVLSTRHDPLLPLHLLRASGELTELRAHDLAFNGEEVEELLESLGVELEPPVLSLLQEQTEGWAAGIRLFSLAHRVRDGHLTVLESLAVDGRLASEYLLAEVLQGQPEEVRDFLLATAVVERFTPELAEALTGRSDSAHLCERLVADNVFIERLDTQPVWYRYHHLFAELLRAELRHTDRGRLRELHSRAAKWYFDSRAPIEAVGHALKAGDTDLVALSLVDGCFELIARTDAAFRFELLDGIPDADVDASPQLSAVLASIDFINGRGRSGVRRLNRARKLWPKQATPPAQAVKTFAELLRHSAKGSYTSTSQSARSLLELAESGSFTASTADTMRAIALAHLGLAQLALDRLVDAENSLTEALEVSRLAEVPYAELASIGGLAWIELIRGRLRRSARIARNAVEFAQVRGWEGSAQMTLALAALSLVEQEWDDLDAAEGHARELADIARRLDDVAARASVAIIQASLCLAGRDLDVELGLERLRGSRVDVGQVESPRLQRSFVVLEARLTAAAAEPDGATTVVAEGIVEHPRSPALEAVRARLSLAAGDPEGALAALRAPTSAAYPVVAIERDVLRALALRALGEGEGALAALEQALAGAEPEGIRRPFLAAGAGVRELLADHLRRAVSHRWFASELLRTLDGVDSTRMLPVELLEPLSARESEVLRFLPTMMSNSDIASELFVSVNTVKTHVKSIYRKLDVTRRQDAVRRARQLHIL